MTKTMKKIFAAVISVVMVATLFAACSGQTEKKVLKLGLDSSFPPMGFTDDTGKIVGFDIDVANEAIKLIDGYDEIQLVPIDWNTKDTELSAGNVDMIWNGFTITDAIRDSYAWTEPYMKNQQTVVVKADSDINTLADLAGKVVISQSESSGLAAIKSNEAIMSSIAKLNEIDNYENALMELESGSADAIVIDQTVIEYKIKQGKEGLKILEETLGQEEYGVAFKKDNTELRDKMQAALEELAKNGKLAEISTKWFGSDITTIGK